jgi:putative acyl-CoA dehydrogenase
VVREALECLGGNGYVEESIMPRLFRESPLNAIWEGSGNVIALDVVRALAGNPDRVRTAFMAELEPARSASDVLGGAIDRVTDTLTNHDDPERNGRTLVERLALAWAGALMTRHRPESVAEAFVRTRLGGEGGFLFGTLPNGADIEGLARLAMPTR